MSSFSSFAVLHSCGSWREQNIPRLPEPDVRDPIFVAEVELEGPELVEGAAVDAQVLLQRFLEELSLVERGPYLSRHAGT